MIGMRVLHSDETVSTRYFHTDHLGSIAVITNETGVQNRLVRRSSWRGVKWRFCARGRRLLSAAIATPR